MKNNPQFAQMADSSMVQCLDAQAQAIWPQERQLFDQYALQAGSRVLDLGCGTCELSSRLLYAYPQWHAIGVDLIEDHLQLAAHRYADLADRLTLLVGDAMDLQLPQEQFDLSICRHLLQAVPDARQVLHNMLQVTRPGGRLHLLAEDYGMLHFSNNDPDLDQFWREGPWKFAAATGTDLRSGRKVVHYLQDLGAQQIQCRMLSVDTLNTERGIFSNIMQAWQAGYAEAIAAHTDFSESQCRDYFDQMIDCINDPLHYAVWNIPVITAIRPLTPDR